MEAPPSSSRGLVFVVEDDEEVRALVERWAVRGGFDVEPFADAEACVAALSTQDPDVVCLDLGLPGMDGITALQLLQERVPSLPIVVVTADREVASVVRAVKAGAYDYLTKPLDETKLLTTLRNAVERQAMARRIRDLERASRPTAHGILGESVALKQALRQLDQVARSDINVLVLGESGSGKELFARAIHAASERAAGPFVPVNCAAVPEALMESEFFGHEKGSFTGASAQRKGRFEQASGGTLFLDEVGELGPALQAKLLRVLQERRFSRVGGNAEIRSNFRLVTATHRDLVGLVRQGTFREDLYFRIAVFELEIPPLRARGGDVPILAQAFLREVAGERKAFGPEALAVLAAYGWPGNVRELHNVVQRAAVVSEGATVQVEHLPERVRACGSLPPSEAPVRAESLEALERDALRRALERSGGNVAQVVRELGIGRTTVYRKMKQYNLR